MVTQLVNLHRDDECSVCDAPATAGTRVWWDRPSRLVICTSCRPVDFESAADGPPLAQRLTAGTPAAAVHAETPVERPPATGTVVNRRRCDARVGTKRPAWDDMVGEHRLARFLDDTFGPGAVVLHGRRVPGTRRTIDHVAVAPNGIWIVDERFWAGLVEIRTTGFWRFARCELYVAGRPRTRAVDSIGWQHRAVRALVEPLGIAAARLRPVLCCIGSSWPEEGGVDTIGDVLIVSPDRLRAIAAEPGTLTPAAIAAIAARLGSGLPAAIHG